MGDRFYGDISGSHGGAYEDDCLVEVYRRFRAIIALMMEVVSTSETSVTFYRTTRRHLQTLSILRNKYQPFFALSIYWVSQYKQKRNCPDISFPFRQTLIHGFSTVSEK
jgi:hypothetical protein